MRIKSDQLMTLTTTQRFDTEVAKFTQVVLDLNGTGEEIKCRPTRLSSVQPLGKNEPPMSAAIICATNAGMN